MGLMDDVGDAVDSAADALGSAMPALDTIAGAAIGIASVLGARIPASLRCTTLPNIGFVPFDFNPEKIGMSRTSTAGNYAMPDPPVQLAGQKTSGGSKKVPKKVTVSKISVDQVVFEGPFTKLRCDTLLTWMNPSSGFLALAKIKKNLSHAPAPLTFQWGPPMIGFMYKVWLTSCKVTYTRFSHAGIPLRAEINLAMDEIPDVLGSLPTNPTSGGLPGRRSHTVASGESLQSIAMENYGTPGLWRRIAEVNGIQDPHRVRPGTMVYLPNPEELTSGSGT